MYVNELLVGAISFFFLLQRKIPLQTHPDEDVNQTGIQLKHAFTMMIPIDLVARESIVRFKMSPSHIVSGVLPETFILTS